jgi:hypothetical protein
MGAKTERKILFVVSALEMPRGLQILDRFAFVPLQQEHIPRQGSRREVPGLVLFAAGG